MSALRSVASSHTRRWFATGAVVLSASITCLPVRPQPQVESRLVEVANSLGDRLIEGRLSGAFEYRPPRAQGGDGARGEPLGVASDLYRWWEHDHALSNARAAGGALLLGGRPDDAVALLADALVRSTGEAEVMDAIHRSDDRALLTDFRA